MTNILVFNPVSGHGHLDSWCALVVRALKDRGHNVQVLTPDQSRARLNFLHLGITDSPSLQFLEWNPSYLEKLKSIAYGGLRIWPRLLQSVPKILALIHKNDAAKTEHKEIDQDVGTIKPVSFAQHVTRSLRNSKIQPDLILNLYIDAYFTSEKQWQQVLQNFSVPIGGFRFVPFLERHEGYLELEKFKGLCLFEEASIARYRNRFPDKIFEFLPDVSSSQLPPTRAGITQKILDRARGRRIVFCGGSIGGQKNISMWGKAIQLLDESEWFFVLIGEQHLHSLSAEDLKTLSNFSLRENVLIHDSYLEDEADFNEVISISDVIFAVYKNFTGSSNMLIKAALFSKPILVSDGHEMGKRVKESKIGYVVSENDVDAIAAALELSVGVQIPEELFQDYRQKHSLEIFGFSLDNFLKKCLEH